MVDAKLGKTHTRKPVLYITSQGKEIITSNLESIDIHEDRGKDSAEQHNDSITSYKRK